MAEVWGLPMATHNTGSQLNTWATCQWAGSIRDFLACETVTGKGDWMDDLLILDGIPRNVPQAKLMEDYIDVLEVIHLVCRDRDRMIDRLQRRALKENRADDAKKEVILRRWEIYQQETQPVLDFYPEEVIREVDAMGSPASVLQHVLEALVPVQETHFSNPIDGSRTG